jgi:hypothetical protein
MTDEGAYKRLGTGRYLPTVLPSRALLYIVLAFTPSWTHETKDILKS